MNLTTFKVEYLKGSKTFTNGACDFWFTMDKEDIVLYSALKGSVDVIDMVTWANIRLNETLLLGAFKELTEGYGKNYAHKVVMSTRAVA